MKKPIQVFSFSIQNQTTDSVDINIDGEIVDAATQAVLQAWFGDTTSTSFKSFRNAINKVDVPIYNVIINSPGGHVGDAMAMHDWMTEMQNKGKIVNTKGIGIVASSATLLLLAGKSPEMSANSWFMMHTVSGGVFGTVDQVENYATTMRKFNNQIRDIYAKKSGMRAEEVTKLMDKETWMTAQEAKDKGLIFKVTGDQQFTNELSKEQWEAYSYSNNEVLNLYNKAVKPAEKTEVMDFKKMFTDLKEFIVNEFKNVKPIPATDKPLEDQQKLIDSIQNSVTKIFEQMINKLESATTEPVDVAAAVETAVKPFKDQIKDLEDDITSMKGEKTNSPENKGDKKPVGSFN